MSNQPMARPTGVTILAILAAIGGVFELLAGLAVLGFSGFLIGAGGGIYGGLATIVGLVILGQAVLALAFAYGAWTLKSWAWVLGVAAWVLSLILSAYSVVSGDAISNQVVSVAIALIVLYYLFTPQVKAAFGRA